MNEKSLRVTNTTAVSAAKATSVVSAAAGRTPGIRRWAITRTGTKIRPCATT